MTGVRTDWSRAGLFRWRVGFEARLIAKRITRPLRQAAARKAAQTRRMNT